eukprot:Pgem_evm1s11843
MFTLKLFCLCLLLLLLWTPTSLAAQKDLFLYSEQITLSDNTTINFTLEAVVVDVVVKEFPFEQTFRFKHEVKKYNTTKIYNNTSAGRSRIKKEIFEQAVYKLPIRYDYFALGKVNEQFNQFQESRFNVSIQESSPYPIVLNIGDFHFNLFLLY